MFWLICYLHNSKYATDFFADGVLITLIATIAGNTLKSQTSRSRWKEQLRSFASTTEFTLEAIVQIGRSLGTKSLEKSDF